MTLIARGWLCPARRRHSIKRLSSFLSTFVFVGFLLGALLLMVNQSQQVKTIEEQLSRETFQTPSSRVIHKTSPSGKESTKSSEDVFVASKILKDIPQATRETLATSKPFTSTDIKQRLLTENIYKPPCPPHPRLDLPKTPYHFIPESLQREVQIQCRSKGHDRSQIKLYPGHIIEFENIVLDFTKRTTYGYSQYASGFLSGDCEIERQDFKLEKISQSYQPIENVLDADVDLVEHAPAIAAVRDDCGNVWHALADFLRVFTSGLVVAVPPQERKVIVLDDRLMISDQPDDIKLCLYHGSLEAMGRKGVIRGVDFGGKRVLFKKLVIPVDGVEGYLNLIWNMPSCDTNTVLTQYVNNLFDYFKMPPLQHLILDRTSHASPKQIQITFSSRRKKPFAPANARIGRVIQNEEEIIQALRQLPDVKVEVVEFFELAFKDQLHLFQRTDILIGMHGAGLANIVYTPPEAAVIELIPYTWRAQEYFNLAGITGRGYFYWRNTIKTNHIEPDCVELAQKKNAEDANICRTGTSETIANVQQILDVTRKAMDYVLEKRQHLASTFRL